VADGLQISAADQAFLAINPVLAQGGGAEWIASTALTAAMSLVDADLGWMFLLDRTMQVLYRQAPLAAADRGGATVLAGQDDAVTLDDPAFRDDPLVYCLRSGGPVRIDDIYGYSGFVCDLSRARVGSGCASASLLAVPIRGQSGDAVGVLALARSADSGRAVPFADGDAAQAHRFGEHVATAMIASRLMVENDFLQGQIGARSSVRKASAGADPFSALIGSSPALTAQLELARRVAPTDVTVLIQGETGTGKDVIARAIHAASGRSAAPFVAQNCAAIPETLLEAELFGWKKGAFSGATGDRPGLFVEAGKGTLFLDEIGDMPVSLQGKLLRVLQERKVRPLGGRVELPVEARIIAATHRNVDQQVRVGTMRADLYYRLAVFPLELPPLRGRQDDIVVLLNAFAADVASRLGCPTPTFGSTLMKALLRYHWPGNVRELRNVVERAVLLGAEGEAVLLDSLSAPPTVGELDFDFPMLTAKGEGGTLKDVVARFEAGMIRQCLSDTGGSLKEASTQLGLPRRTLADKIRRYGLGQIV
jgi:sigma-54-dependent transcriptional regulator